MSYDKRTALPQDHDFEISDQNTGNTYSVTIEKELGRGGSCIVYTGRLRDRVGNEQVTRSVIVKELYPKELDDAILRTETMDLTIPEHLRDVFRQRLELFCAGQASYIIYANDNAGRVLPPTTYSGTAHNTFYAVSQRGQGNTLSDMDRQSLSLADALIIAASVCDAIHEIHARGMNLYLDCKPDNICVFEDKAYLFDFDTVQPRGRFRFCSYSEGWSAPEQVFKDSGGYIKPQKIGFHTDVFSIGAVLFYLLVGRKPTDDDLNRIKDGYDWRAEITLDKSGGALKDESFVKELDRVMRSLLEQDPDARRLDFGDKEATAKVAHDFRHLLELAENAPYRRGFEDTNDHITRAKELILDKQDEILSLLRNISLHESKTPHSDKGSADEQHTEKPTEECRNPNRTNSMRDDISAPVFNSIIDHPVYGDEREFVHIREHGKTDWLRSITLETGKQYEVEIRFRNDASEKYNGKEYHHVGIAFRSVLAVDLPIYLNRHEDGITVRISAENAASASQDSVKLIPGVSGLQYLHYVAGSCKISCKWKANGQIMPSSIFRFTKGTLLGLNGLNGIIPGGDEFAGRVCFVFEVKDHKEQSDPKQQVKRSWGPEREMFTMKNPARYPSINSIKDNPTIGDERAFLKIGEISKENTVLKNGTISLTPGSRYLVYIYCHNACSSTYFDETHGHSGVATGVRLSSMYPASVSPDAPGTLYAVITGSNTKPEKVWAKIILTSQKEVDLVLEGNAKIYNDWKLNNSELPSSLFSPSGVLLGMNELNGIMFGEESHCIITYVLCVAAKRSHNEMFTEIKKLADELPDHQLSSRSQNGSQTKPNSK